jgi:hypothetical protein
MFPLFKRTRSYAARLQKEVTLFCDNPDLHQKFIKWCTQNLSDLNVVRARQFLRDKLFSDAVKLTKGAEPNKILTKMLQYYHLSETPSTSIVWERLNRCGFSYENRTKHFFVDSHKAPANRCYQKEQTARYLKREHCMHRWFQLSLKDYYYYQELEMLVP